MNNSIIKESPRQSSSIESTTSVGKNIIEKATDITK
jgi:hypothetical protein